VAGNQRIELKLKAWKRSRMKLNWNVPYRGLGFDGNGTIESVYSQSSQYYVISAVGLNNYQYAREPWCYLQAYPLVSKFRITCKSKKVKFRGKFILNFKKNLFKSNLKLLVPQLALEEVVRICQKKKICWKKASLNLLKNKIWISPNLSCAHPRRSNRSLLPSNKTVAVS